ncbi:MAG: hypothetical protein AABW56_02900 [Nanoarchaeota archaeon]
MKKSNEESLDILLSHIKNGANLSDEDLDLFKTTKYCDYCSYSKNKDVLLVLKIPIADQTQIKYYYNAKNKLLPYSRTY